MSDNTPPPSRQAETAQKRCEPCRATGAVHCDDPENCGGPWDKSRDPLAVRLFVEANEMRHKGVHDLAELLDEANAAIAHAAPQGLQEVHAVQWYADGGRTRCLEVFDDIGEARRFAGHLPIGASAWITTMAVRGETYVRAFCEG